MNQRKDKSLRILPSGSSIVMCAGALCGSVLLTLGGCGQSPVFVDAARIVPQEKITAHLAAADTSAPSKAADRETASRSVLTKESRKLVRPKKKPFPGHTKRKSAVTYKKVRGTQKIAAAPADTKCVFEKLASHTPLEIQLPPAASVEVSASEVEWLEAQLENWDSGESEALDTFKAVEMSITDGLEESPLLTDANLSSSPVQLDPELVYGSSMPLEPRVMEKVGRFQQNQFPQIRGLLAELREGADTFAKPLRAPKGGALDQLTELPQVDLAAVPAPVEKKIAEIREPAKADAPVAASASASAAAALTSAVVAPVTRTAESAVEAVQEKITDVKPETEVASETPTPVFDATTALASPAPELGPTLASPTLPVPVLPSAPITVAKSAARTVTTQVAPTTQVTQVRESQEEPEALGTQLTVQVRIGDDKETDVEDTKFADWLEQTQGHIEVYLQPKGGRIQQDVVHLSCTRPEYECEVDARELRGTYQMMANVFTRNERYPYGQFVYEEEDASGKMHVADIDASNAKKHFLFVLRGSNLKRRYVPPSDAEKREAESDSAAVVETVPLMIPVFEATLPEMDRQNPNLDISKPKHIAGAQVRLVGFPELATGPTAVNGALISDKLGTARFAKVPVRSQYLVQVTAPGYLPTFKPVPVFTSHAYDPVFLIPEKFRGRAPKDSAVILGRIFDPVSRQPLAGEQLQLKYWVGKTVYPDAGSEPLLYATSNTGLFGWPGLKRGFRAIFNGADKTPFGIFARAGAGNYVEINRGGQRDLYGRFENEFTRQPVSPAVRLFGQSEGEGVISDAKGQFMFPKLGFSRGVVSLVSSAVGYTDFLHTVSWDTLERSRRWRLPMLPEASVRNAAQQAAKAAGVKLDERAGFLVGYVNGEFLSKQSDGLYTKLIDANGSEPLPANGPFPYTGARTAGEPVRLDGSQSAAVYINLPDGQFVWRLNDSKGKPVRGRIVQVQQGHVSIVNN